MIEYVAQIFNAVDFLGMGPILILMAFSLGISLLVANGKTQTFMFIFLIMNYVFATGVWVGTAHGEYFIITAAITLIVIILPDNWSEGTFGRQKR